MMSLWVVGAELWPRAFGATASLKQSYYENQGGAATRKAHKRALRGRILVRDHGERFEILIIEPENYRPTPYRVFGQSSASSW
jgi:hypothetical protein